MIEPVGPVNFKRGTLVVRFVDDNASGGQDGLDLIWIQPSLLGEFNKLRGVLAREQSFLTPSPVVIPVRPYNYDFFGG